MGRDVLTGKSLSSPPRSSSALPLLTSLMLHLYPLSLCTITAFPFLLFAHSPFPSPSSRHSALHASATLTFTTGNQATSSLKLVMLKDIYFFPASLFFQVATGSRPRSANLMFILSQLPGGSCILAVPVLNLCFFLLFCFLSSLTPPIYKVSFVIGVTGAAAGGGTVGRRPPCCRGSPQEHEKR